MDAFEAIENHGPWDLVLAFPVCTYLCRSGIHWNNRGRGWEKTNEALDVVRRLISLQKSHGFRMAIENPVGLIGTRIMPCTQTIQPYQFGEDASKRTCLWLFDLPPLIPDDSQFIPPRLVCSSCWNPRKSPEIELWCGTCGADIDKMKPRWGNQTDKGQNRLGQSKSRVANRARTYPGIAQAFADQWGKIASIFC